MAEYTTDAFGNPTGYIDEEERKKREAQNPSFFNQLSTKIGDAIGRVPENFSRNLDNFTNNVANAPSNFANNVQAAVSPNNTFAALQQVESGNRDFDGAGNPIQSPKGAMYRNQVMPATAANPGYGIRPVQNQSPEEYNRVGQEYYQAMLKQFGGDEQKALAAYNAGPGRVQKNITANSGQMNVGQLPQETQSYLQKVGNVVNKMIPSAQAGTVPQPPANVGSSGFQAYDRNRPGNAAFQPPSTQAQPAPTAAASPYSLATGVPQQGLGTPQQRAMPQAQPGMGPDTTTQAIGRFQLLQDNQDAMFKMGYDETQPEYLRTRAKERGIQLYNQQRELTAAEKKLPTLTPGQVADTIKGGKNSVGDWAQYLLFKHLGLNDLANQKGEQLGIGHAWENSTITDENGKERSVELLRSASGKTLSGKFTGKDGADLSQDQLEQASAGVLGKGVHVTKVENVINPESGERIQEQVLSNGKTRYRKGGQAYAGDTSLFQNAQAWEKDQDQKSAAANRFLSTNYAAGATAQQQFNAYRQAGVHPRYIESMMGYPEGTLTKQAGKQPNPAVEAEKEATIPTAAGRQEDIYATPTQRPGESGKDFAVRKDNIEAKQKPMIKTADSFINKSAGIQSTLTGMAKAIRALDSGEHNIGPILGGPEGSQFGAPVAQALGGLRGTEASQNTNWINSYMTEAGLATIKDTMGPAISNFDIQQKLRQMPVSLRSNPKEIREFLMKEYKSVYDQAERANNAAERLNLIQPGSIDLGPPPAELAKAPEKKNENSKVDMNNPTLKKLLGEK
jgi:hypothetical protein